MIKYKGYDISYKEMDNYFNEMKKNREEREKDLNEIAKNHKEILLEYNKTKPPIDDNSLNTFRFKEITDEIPDINFSINNSLYHLLNNIIRREKEKELKERIEEMEQKYTYLCIITMALFINYFLIR